MSAIQTYTENLLREFQSGQAREHGYRPHLKTLLETLDKQILAVNDPKHSEGGAPDFILMRQIIPIAFIETKDIGVALDREVKTNQLGRYRDAYSNLILTDYLEFRWFRDGEHIETVSIGDKRNGTLNFEPDKFAALESLLERYFHAVTPTVNSAEQLASKMAVLARDIANLIKLYLADETADSKLHRQKLVFEQELIPSLNDAQFADMYAQTLAYGLFAARVNYNGKPEQFTLKTAFWELPNTNPFLKKLFQSFATELDERVARWGEVVARLLAHAKIDDILENFGKRTKQTDPVIHFYETFLSEYSPKERERRGVYYTPEPVVGYIVRSVDHVLKTHFKREDGLGDKQTLILDPATGTGTFLYFVVQHIHEQMVTNGGQGGRWSGYVREHLLRRIFGFELLMAPYTIAHMKLQILLKELQYDFKREERLGVYLTNALELRAEEQQHLKEGLRAELSSEAAQAGDVKTEEPIMVVLGNPPYSGHSANENQWISDLLQSYYWINGKKLKERNSKWLRDDYVKFIRMGQERIAKTGYGVLAFVTNHGYLDNPTFRGMRQSLLQTFTDIYVLDLHGNTKKKEKTPDGAPDKNVFDIQQGVAIGIFIKDPNKQVDMATVHHAHLWGAQRAAKYDWLDTHAICDTEWTVAQPQSPYYLFVPQDTRLLEEYQAGWKVTEAFPANVLGFQTHRDSVAVGYTQEQLEKQITTYLGSMNDDLKNSIHPTLYRPFDVRYTTVSTQVNDRPRRELIQHVAGKDNLCLLTLRQTKLNDWQHAYMTRYVAPAVAIEIKDGASVLPLYLYRDPNKFELPGEDEFPYDGAGRRPNFSVQFIRQLEQKLGKTFQTDFTPEDVFYYAYAVFHSRTYRSRYAEFLKIDFPRLPLTSDWSLFQQLAAYGAELTCYHLLTQAGLKQHGITYPVAGTNAVENRYPVWQDDKVYINKTQYFGNVSEDEWAFVIGGYQVLEKWLKDRRGYELSDDELETYQKIVNALRETSRLMDEVDEVLRFPIV
jgi:predicted helicase